LAKLSIGLVMSALPEAGPASQGVLGQVLFRDGVAEGLVSPELIEDHNGHENQDDCEHGLQSQRSLWLSSYETS